MKTYKVLVADDDRNICELLRLYLEKEGYTVQLCYNGKDALDAFAVFKPDLLLLDVMMPIIDGWQVCATIRKKYQTPIMLLTAKGEVMDKVYGLDELGADEVFSLIRDTNVASQNVAKRNGMCIRGTYVKHYFGMDMPHYIFSVKRNADEK